MINASYHTSLSYLNAVDASDPFSCRSPAFPVAFLEKAEPHIIGNFFLIQQYLLHEDSHWWHYIRLLPQPTEPSSVPATWSPDDLALLKGTNAYPAILKRKALWKDDYERAISLLDSSNNGSAASSAYAAYSFSLYEWAACIFGSRSFRASLTIPLKLFQDHEKA